MTAIFFYSTGRCGTQWFTKNFGDSLGPDAEVVHEPLGARWAPRRSLRHPDLAALRREMPDVDRHLDRVAATVAAGRTYVETGWPAMGWYPYLKTMLGDKFKWVHIVRNPIFVAGSLITHHCYAPNDALYDKEFGALGYFYPTDPGVAHGEFAAEWERLTQFEKCLYQWLEVNQYATELAAMPGFAPARVEQFESVFSGSDASIRALYRSLGLAEPATIDLGVVDKFRRREPVNPELASSRLWQQVETLALKLGYDRDALGPAANLKSVSRHFRRYERNARGATGFKKARRMVKAMMLDMLGR